MTTLVVLVLALVVWHVVKRVFWPERACPNVKCEGGKVYAPDRKSWRRHGRCDGKGFIS